MALSGLASGFDWKSIVDQLIEVSRAPQNRMRAEQQTNTKKSSALDDIRGKVATLQSSLSALSSPDAFLKKSATLFDTASDWTASSTANTPSGTYEVENVSAATVSKLVGRKNIGRYLEPYQNLSEIWAGTTITPGTFTINGKIITISDTSNQTLDSIFTQIEAQAGVQVTSWAKWYEPPTGTEFDPYRTSSSSPSNPTPNSVGSVVSSGGNNFNVTTIENGPNGPYFRLNTTSGLTVGDTMTGGGLPTNATIKLIVGDAVQLETPATYVAPSTRRNSPNNAATGLWGDVVTLKSTTSSPVNLGSATDTSNFLQVMRLYNPSAPSTTVSSTVEPGQSNQLIQQGLGMLNLTDYPINNGTINFTSRFNQRWQGGFMGPSTEGLVARTDTNISTTDKTNWPKFQVNGVDIKYNTNVTTIQDILNDITNSSAGVSATYDRKLDQILLTNKKTGNLAINITANAQDTSDLAFALGLTAQSATGALNLNPSIGSPILTLGANQKFKVNGGGVLEANSTTITESDHGIAGLSINMKSLGTQKIIVGGDSTSAKEALNNFIKAYNDVQNSIENYTKVTVTGTKVTSAILAGNQELRTLSRSLRSSLFQSAGLSGTVNRLSDLGVNTTGIENTISLTNATALESKLASASSDVTNFLQAATTGFVARFKTILGNVVSESGSAAGGFKTTQESLTKQNTSIDKQIEDMERRLTSQRSMMEASFIAMERAQAGFQQQAGYLAKAFAGNN